MILADNILKKIKEHKKELDMKGDLPSDAHLAKYYENFRKRFGPDRLRNLDGEALLEAIHDHRNRDSLVYWLEFKNDEEPCASAFHCYRCR